MINRRCISFLNHHRGRKNQTVWTRFCWHTWEGEKPGCCQEFLKICESSRFSQPDWGTGTSQPPCSIHSRSQKAVSCHQSCHRSREAARANSAADLVWAAPWDAFSFPPAPGTFIFICDFPALVELESAFLGLPMLLCQSWVFQELFFLCFLSCNLGCGLIQPPNCLWVQLPSSINKVHLPGQKHVHSRNAKFQGYGEIFMFLFKTAEWKLSKRCVLS